jgi:hypothetical protein
LEDELLHRNISLVQVSFDILNKELFNYCVFYNTKREFTGLQKIKKTKKLLTPVRIYLTNLSWVLKVERGTNHVYPLFLSRLILLQNSSFSFQR